MQIVALCYVSMSELAAVLPSITYDWIEQNTDQFNKVLYDLGMNVDQLVDIQEDIMHRNRFDKVVQCTRWVGNERTDPEWIASGYASQAAIDKSKNSRMLIDLYRLRGMVE